MTKGGVVSAECNKCGHDLDYDLNCKQCELSKLEVAYDELKAEAMKLRDALEFYNSCHICSRCNPRIQEDAVNNFNQYLEGAK